MYTSLAEQDESARIILLYLIEKSGWARLTVFADEMQDQHPGMSIHIITELWTKYMGWDGRTKPTHDIETGLRLGPGGLLRSP